MKKLLTLLFLLSLSGANLIAQTKTASLEIFSITEYIDGYVIKGIGKLNGDTLSLISVKKRVEDEDNYERLVVGNEYDFEFENLASPLPIISSKAFIIRIKNTVVWKSGDRIKDIPVFSSNTQGIYIRRKRNK